jgi:hypothetical protein
VAAADPNRQADEDPAEVLAEQTRARRYSIFVECVAIAAGFAAIGFAFWASRLTHARSSGFYVDIGASVGTALVLVGVLLRIQRAIAARLDATRAAVAAVQLQFSAEMAEINRRISQIAKTVAPATAAQRPPAPRTASRPVPSSPLLGEWLICQLQRLRLVSQLIRLRLVLSLQPLTAMQHSARRRLSGRAGRIISVAVGICAIALISYVVLAALSRGNTRSGSAADTTAQYPPSELAATYAASAIRASCTEAKNLPGIASTVDCSDGHGNSLIVRLGYGGPWSGIVFPEQELPELPAKPGSCANEPHSSEATRSKFDATQGEGEVYCFTSDADFGFNWYFGTGKYIASAQLILASAT